MQQPTNTNTKRIKWGIINGKEVWLFTLENKKGSSLTVSNYGAIVQSLKLSDKKYQVTDVLLGYDNLNDYKKDEFFIGAVIGRCANRIEGGIVAIENDRYSLSIKDEGYHQHGGKSGFNKKVWEVVDVSDQNIRLFYKSVDGEEGFPGNLSVMVSYSFDDDDTWTVEYEATTDKPTLINLTQHAYFNLDGHDAGTVLDHQLRINAEKYLPVNRLHVPSGKLSFVRGTPFDFSERLPIGIRINEKNEQIQLGDGYDHSWVLEEAHTNTIKHAATVNSLKTGIELNVYTTEPALHVYSGNYLNDFEGKSNAYYKKRSGLCLETQHFPDAPNHAHFPSIVLKPLEVFQSKTIFQFSIIG
jgi:Galactose mutarotase and related enzymes